MTASNAFENAILDLVFSNQAFAKIGDSSGLQPSGADGSLYISLHTGDPGEAGDQTTNEASYTGYGRKAVGRTAGWDISGPVASNENAITFDECTGGSDTITHFGVGTDGAGAGVLLFSGTCDLEVSTGITPEFAIGALTVTVE